MISKFFNDGGLKDQAIEEAVKQALSRGSAAEPASLVATITALFILKEVFSDYKDEYEMIEEKAKDFLKVSSVQNLGKLMKRIQLVIRDTR